MSLRTSHHNTLQTNLRNYDYFAQVAKKICPNRVFTSALSTFAYGVDASCYSYTPKIAIYAWNEKEIIMLLKLAKFCNTPITFRAAGSSLSGQASSDSILVIANQGWKKIRVLDNGKRISLQCGVVGEDANKALKPYHKKIGPDPATINTALIGGIINNNSSGMCCGVEQNSYHTISSIRVITVDGILLDTSDKKSIQDFIKTQSHLIDSLLKLRSHILANPQLTKMIKRKYQIKNTTGFSINALIDFSEIKEILNHIFIGSEGCLAFISEVVYHCVDDEPHKACGLIFFSDLNLASEAVTILAKLPPKTVNAAEIMDYACLMSANTIPELREVLQDIQPQCTCILLQTQHFDLQKMQENLTIIQKSLESLTVSKALYTTDSKIYDLWWKIRKSLLPLSAKNRPKDSIVITEDICFEISYFCKGIAFIQHLFTQFHYDGIIFGHALSGNIHFIITPSLNNIQQKEHFGEFMQSLARGVSALFGSIKAEHGTGRMVAPFVAMEWGKEAYYIHQEIKKIFDPNQLLNPDVIITTNPQVYLQNFKTSQKTMDFIDHCMECGFCEKSCPSRFLTLTPRQRIASIREITRLYNSKNPQEILKAQEMQREYTYFGVETCATCSMCKIHCPIEIDVAKIALQYQQKPTHKVAETIYHHFDTFLKIAGGMLSIGNITQKIFHPIKLYQFSKILHQKVKFIPIVPIFLPQKNHFFNQRHYKKEKPISTNFSQEVIYFSTCINRVFKPSKFLPDKRPLQEVLENIAQKANIKLIYPKNIKELCCKKPFHTIHRIAKDQTLASTLWQLSKNGKIPILVDHSACSAHMILEVAKKLPLTILDSTEFIYLATKNLAFKKLDKKIAIHQMCALKKLHKEDFIVELVKKCTDHFQILDQLSCCGFAGHKGFFTPELNDNNISSLDLKNFDLGVSSSSTCEIGLSTKLPFLNVAYLVEQALI